MSEIQEMTIEYEINTTQKNNWVEIPAKAEVLYCKALINLILNNDKYVLNFIFLIHTNYYIINIFTINFNIINIYFRR